MAEHEKHERREQKKEKQPQASVEGGHTLGKEHEKPQKQHAHPAHHEVEPVHHEKEPAKPVQHAENPERGPLARRLQPRLPRKVKFSREMHDKRLLMGLVIAVAAVVLILLFMWLKPPASPEPANTLTDSQVRNEIARTRMINLKPLSIDTSDYPKVIGIYKGRTLEEVYYCSDVCPDYGAVYLVYQGVGPEDCSRAGGKVVRDIAWGGYIGCEPRV